MGFLKGAFNNRSLRSFEEIQGVNKISEYQKRKKEILERLKLDKSQTSSKELLLEYEKIETMRSEYLEKIKNADRNKAFIQSKLSDITSKLLMTTDIEEEKELLEMKNEYKQQIDQLEDMKNINIYPTIKKTIIELSSTDLSNKAQKEFKELDKKIVDELETLRKEAEEKNIVYRNLEEDLLDIQEKMYFVKVRELYQDLKNPNLARIESNHNVRYVVYSETSTGEKKPY